MTEKNDLLPPRPPRKVPEGLPEAPDEWVESRTAKQKEPRPAPAQAVAAPAPAPAFHGVKRITVEVSPALHLKIKKYCVANGKNIADEVRAMLMERFK